MGKLWLVLIVVILALSGQPKNIGAIDLQAQIDACSYGCVVQIPAGVTNLTSPLDLRGKSGITLRGVGTPRKLFNSAPVEGTTLKYTGSACSCAVIEAGNSYDTVIERLAVDAGSGANEAAYALRIESSIGGRFDDLDLRGGTVRTLHWGTLLTSLLGGNAYNSSSRVNVVNLETEGVRLDGTVSVSTNTHHNSFNGYSIRHFGAGFVCANADGNTITALNTVRAAGSTAYGAELLGSAETNGKGTCRYNDFAGVVQFANGAGLISRAGSVSHASANKIEAYSLGNGGVLPVIEMGSTLCYETNLGVRNC